MSRRKWIQTRQTGILGRKMKENKEICKKVRKTFGRLK